MATLISSANGNFTSAATWKVVDTTSELDSQAAQTASTTSFVASASFIPGAITVDGMAIKLQARSASPTGTFTIELFNLTDALSVATVVVNITDFNSIAGGWYLFEFSSVTLIAGKSYQVRIKSSTASQVTLYRDATAGNWSRMLRTTTNQAPSSSDKLVIGGGYTAAAISSIYTVTMDNTNTTIFGQVQISNKGILDYGTAPTTNYYLKIAGNLTIYAGGTCNFGTLSTPIPSDSTAKLEFANTSNVQFGIEATIGSNLIGYGAAKTVKAFLNANASVGATSLTTDVTTNWKSGDVIAIASTTRTATEAESRALTIDASGTTLTVAALTNAHSGSAPTKAEIANLTRNVKIFGTSTVFQAYINISSTATINLNYIEFYNMGSATASKRGIDIATTTGSCSINNCSLHDFTVASSIGLNINSASSNNTTINNNVSYNMANSSLILSATTGTNNIITNNLFMRSLAGTIMNISDLNGTFTGNTATSGSAAGIQYSDLTFVSGNIDNNTSHSNATIGHQLVNISDVGNATTAISNIVSWNNNTFGITLNNIEGIYINGISVFGSLTSNIEFTGVNASCRINNITSNSGLPLSSPIGLSFASDSYNLIIDNSTFGIVTTHSTADISVRVSNVHVKAVFRNCLFSSTNKIVNVNTNTTRNSHISCSKYQQTAGNHIDFAKLGTTTIDTTIFNNSSPSARLTPNNATYKLESSIKKAALANNKIATVSAYIRKSVVGDGAAYNGNQPRLILKADPSIGIMTDTVLATVSASAGTWQKITGTTPAITDNGVIQLLIDCDGTAGWINIDDWSIV